MLHTRDFIDMKCHEALALLDITMRQEEHVREKNGTKIIVQRESCLVLIILLSYINIVSNESMQRLKHGGEVKIIVLLKIFEFKIV